MARLVSTHKTRGQSALAAVDDLRASLLPGDDGRVIVCSGPPVCHLVNEDAVAAQKHGCTRCTSIAVNEATFEKQDA